MVTSQLKAVADRVKDWSKIVIAYEPIWLVADALFFEALSNLTLVVVGLSALARSQLPNKHKKFTPPSANGLPQPSLRRPRTAPVSFMAGPSAKRTARILRSSKILTASWSAAQV